MINAVKSTAIAAVFTAMIDLLVTVFEGKTKARILEVLLSHPDQRYHLRGLAPAVGTDSGNTSKLLKLLVEGGLVVTGRERNSTL